MSEVSVKDELIADIKKHIKVEIDLEGLVLSQLDKVVIPAVDAALEKVKKAIPGQIDDVVIDSAKPILYAAIKEELSKVVQKLEDKIDEKLGNA